MFGEKNFQYFYFLMLNMLHICLLIQRCVLSKQNIDYYSSFLLVLIGIKVLWRSY